MIHSVILSSFFNFHCPSGTDELWFAANGYNLAFPYLVFLPQKTHSSHRCAGHVATPPPFQRCKNATFSVKLLQPHYLKLHPEPAPPQFGILETTEFITSLAMPWLLYYVYCHWLSARTSVLGGQACFCSLLDLCSYAKRNASPTADVEQKSVGWMRRETIIRDSRVSQIC